MPSEDFITRHRREQPPSPREYLINGLCHNFHLRSRLTTGQGQNETVTEMPVCASIGLVVKSDYVNPLATTLFMPHIIITKALSSMTTRVSIHHILISFVKSVNDSTWQAVPFSGRHMTSPIIWSRFITVSCVSVKECADDCTQCDKLSQLSNVGVNFLLLGRLLATLWDLNQQRAVAYKCIFLSIYDWACPRKSIETSE